MEGATKPFRPGVAGRGLGLKETFFIGEMSSSSPSVDFLRGVVEANISLEPEKRRVRRLAPLSGTRKSAVLGDFCGVFSPGGRSRGIFAESSSA